MARKPSRQAGSLTGAPGALNSRCHGARVVTAIAGANYFLVLETYHSLTRNTKQRIAMSKPTRDTELAALGRALRALRDQAGITQEELAVRLQMDPTYISRIERGRRGVQWLTVQRFLHALDTDLHQLADALDVQEHSTKKD